MLAFVVCQKYIDILEILLSFLISESMDVFTVVPRSRIYHVVSSTYALAKYIFTMAARIKTAPAIADVPMTSAKKVLTFT